MSYPYCFIWLSFWLVVSILPAQAQTNFVTLGNYRVHPTRILARFNGAVTPQSSLVSLQSLGLKIQRQYQLVPGLVMLDEANAITLTSLHSVDAAIQRQRLTNRIERLKNSGLFAYVEPDYIVSAFLTPTDSAFVDGTLWALRNQGQNGGLPGADIGVTNAWDITTGSTNVIVAVIDTGIRYTHKDLAKQMWRNPGEVAGNRKDDDADGYVDDVFGINAITGTGDPLDDNDHGTHVSGTIGAAANDGNPHVGISWHVQLMGCKFLNDQGFGATSDAITCIDFAVSKGARILNNSWGGGPFEQSLFDAINRARLKGVLFVAAAGNAANNNDVLAAYPATYQLDNVISVAAIDRRDDLVDFSNFGRTTVHLGAPGVDIFSSTATSDTSYDTFSGTSMAAPHVSGVAALILSKFPGAKLAEVRGRILSSTVPIPSLAGKTTTGGRLNAYNALTIMGSGLLQVSIDPPSGSTLLAGSTQAVFVAVNDLFGVVDATVTASIPGVTNLVFANDGKAPDQTAGDNIYSTLLQVPDAITTITMTVVTSGTNRPTVTNVVNYTIVAKPSNDNFADAAKILPPGALILSNNKFATIEPNEPKHAGVVDVAASLWWDWSPINDTPVLIDTTGSSVDTVLAIYTGKSLATLKEVVATNDVGQRKQAYVSFSAKAGATYRIAVASVDTNSVGSIRLRVTPGGKFDTDPPQLSITSPPSGFLTHNKQITITGTASDPAPNASGVKEVLLKVNGQLANPASGTTNWSAPILLKEGVNTVEARADDAAGNSSPIETIQVYFQPSGVANDFFVQATELTATASVITATNTLATKEPGEPNHAGNEGGKSLWWRFRASSNGVLFLSTTNSSFDTLLGLYTGNRVNALTPIASNDDAFDGSQISKLTQGIEGNQTYYIAVDGYGGESGSINLEYTFTSTNISKLTITPTAGGTVMPSSGLFENNSMVVLSAIPDPTFEFAGWSGGITSKDNPLSVMVTGDLALSAQFSPRIFSDDFESGGLNHLAYTTSGNASWRVEQTSTNPVNFAARSGSITHNQRSSLILTATSGSGGTGSFDFKVSSEQNWDFLQFYLNGIRQQRWSGDVDWQTYEFALPAGQSTMEWRYSKDASISVGLDAAFIDNLLLPKDKPDKVILARLVMAHVAPGQVQIRVDGQPGQQYVIQASTDLQTWESVSTNVATQGLIKFVDEDASRYPVRFYRVIERK